MAQKRKFYATLPHKIDTAIEDYQKQLPKEEDPWEFTETLEGDTPLGGEMRSKYKYK